VKAYRLVRERSARLTKNTTKIVFLWKEGMNEAEKVSTWQAQDK
jgi:hypothetical protein